MPVKLNKSYTAGPVPKEAVDYFRSKGWKPSFDYRDVWKEEHAIAFTVAKAMNQDVLESIRGAMDRAIAEGRTFRDFKKELQPELEKLGWWGKREQVDPKTGEKKLVQLGSPRRLQIIYRQNLRSAQAAGQWERIERTKDFMPYLKYELGPSRQHRDQHVQWSGLILSIDDPWWNTHYPPNGWGCKCRVLTMSAADAENEGGISKAPPIRYKQWQNPRTGEIEKVPEGITPGFDFNPGKARLRPHSAQWADALPKTADPQPLGYEGGNLPPLPAPRIWKGPTGYGEVKGDEKLVDAFLKPFGAKVGEGAVFVDKAGWPLVIDEELFRDRLKGGYKIAKFDRDKHLVVLSDTIRDPDEIWMRWQKKGARWRLVRSYLARWVLQDGQTAGYSVFQMEGAEWTGVTLFPPQDKGLPADQDAYLEKQRTGLLMYRRK